VAFVTNSRYGNVPSDRANSKTLGSLLERTAIQSFQDFEVAAPIVADTPSELQPLEKKEYEGEMVVIPAKNSRKLVLPINGQRDTRNIMTGVAFTIGFICLLAVFGTTTQNGQLTLFQGSVVTNIVEDVGDIVDNVKEAVLPESASDVVSILLGEGIAGAFGGAADFVATSFLTSKILSSTTLGESSSSSDSSTTTLWTNSGGGDASERDVSSVSVSEAVTEAAVAGGDYFMTRAAAIPLLNALGLPPSAATLVSVLVATVPYEIIKLAYQRKMELDEETMFMDQLLKEQQQSIWSAFSWSKRQVNPNELEPYATDEGIDFVDVFADVIKWLAYDVMQTLFGGTTHWYGQLLDPVWESAFFGLVAGLSSQLYADISYNFIGFGPMHKHDQAKNKTATELFTTLSISCLSGAILFGVYETVSNGIAANNVSPCTDASDFDMCLGHYVSTNLLGTSTWDAKGRALVTAVVSTLLRLQHLLGL
jgi:hypothetical protein